MTQKVRRIYRPDDIVVLMPNLGQLVIISGYDDLPQLMGRHSAAACR
jgi:hypothetical protein